MSWLGWTIIGLACWIIVCFTLFIAWIAVIEHNRRRKGPNRPAAEETGVAPDSQRRHPPGAPSAAGPHPWRPVDSQAPAATGQTARTICTIDVLDCACAVTYYRASQLKGTRHEPCAEHQCALCRWVTDRLHAVYRYEPCPAHEGQEAPA